SQQQPEYEQRLPGRDTQQGGTYNTTRQYQHSLQEASVLPEVAARSTASDAPDTSTLSCDTSEYRLQTNNCVPARHQAAHVWLVRSQCCSWVASATPHTVTTRAAIAMRAAARLRSISSRHWKGNSRKTKAATSNKDY